MNLYSLFEIEKPIIQAPMAGVQNWELAAAVSNSGGLGSIPCGMLTKDQVISEIKNFKKHSNKQYNLNFFCHKMPAINLQMMKAWQEQLSPYYESFSIKPSDGASNLRVPFDMNLANAIEAYKPPILSFHFGLPSQELVTKIKSWGSIVISSATTKEEGIWLEKNGADAVIAQGFEAGGHRAMFMTSEPSTQMLTSELVHCLKHAVSVPVIAAGGIATNSDIKKLIALGASGAQVGTAYLLCDEAKTSKIHRDAIKSKSSTTALTNIFSGRLARGITNKIMKDLNFITDEVPDFPYASIAIDPLRKKSETQNKSDFTPLWSGTNRSGCKEISAEKLTNALWGNGI
ncbi:MAG: nitronate monooxygenase [Gammaproteobacteria bacterium]|nr:nitronate monooxygenase [Gammaproteobacteria bacterium]